MAQLVVYTNSSPNNENNLRIQQAQRSGAYDAVDKLRVSQPQSLIDTDFEYGQQSTKWEQIALQQNRAGAYYYTNQTAPLLLQNPIAATITTSGKTVTVNSSLNPVVGTPIFIQDTLDSNVNGWWLVASASSTQFTFVVINTPTTTNIYNPSATYVYQGYFYSQSAYNLNTASAFTYSGTTITVTTNFPHGLSAGSLIYVANVVSSSGGGVTGAYVVATVPTLNTFTYVVATAPTGTLTNAVTNTITPNPVGVQVTSGGGTFSYTASSNGNALQVGNFLTISGTLNSQATGAISGYSNPTTYLITAASATTFTLQTTAGVAITTTSGTLLGLTFTTANSLYMRPAGWVATHAYDGSVNFTVGSSIPNQDLIRQTRRYFRYQSGKGIQFSTGSILKPRIQQPFLTFTVSNNIYTVTVTSPVPHNLQINSYIAVSGCDQAAYNGNFRILTVPTPTTFTYVTLNNGNPVVSPATSTGAFIIVSPTIWYGSVNRLGFFDLQNGMFFEYSGSVLSCVWRNSVNQVDGQASVTQGSSLVVGSNTCIWSTQLFVGDNIVIRGQTYRVLNIVNNSTMYISPEYRGTSNPTVFISRTIDTKVPQSQWWDVCDGSFSASNPSGYNLDLTKIQMWYMDYSWYGAGVIRFGFRMQGGAILYVYGFQNNNIQYTAYMRSGNLPSHYEQNGQLAQTLLTASIGAGDSTIPVVSTTGFNPAGGNGRIIGNSATLLAVTASSTTGNFTFTTQTGMVTGLAVVVSGTNTGTATGITAGIYYTIATTTTSQMTLSATFGGAAITTTAGTTTGLTFQIPALGTIEYFSYLTLTPTSLLGCTRGTTGGAAATAFPYTLISQTAVEYSAPDTAAVLSHWGSSVVMDGGFTNDVSLIFNYGTSGITVNNGATVPILAIRVAPSVDNGTVGVLGNKEVINRLQLQLRELGVQTTGTFLIQLILNGIVSEFKTGYGGTASVFQSPTQNNTFTSSISQVAVNGNGGNPAASYAGAATITGGESIAASYSNAGGQTTLDLTAVAAIGNAGMGGGISQTVGGGTQGTFPDGPDILYVVVTNLSGTGQASISGRISWQESQA